MPLVEFTDSDLLRNKLVEPGWYQIDLGQFTEWTPAKSGTSNNCTCEGVVVCNDDNGSTDFAGVPVTIQFNDSPKARGFMEGFLRANGVTVEAKRYDLAAANGRRIVAYIENETWEGRMRNRINHKYRQMKAA